MKRPATLITVFAVGVLVGVSILTWAAVRDRDEPVLEVAPLEAGSFPRTGLSVPLTVESLPASLSVIQPFLCFEIGNSGGGTSVEIADGILIHNSDESLLINLVVSVATSHEQPTLVESEFVLPADEELEIIYFLFDDPENPERLFQPVPPGMTACSVESLRADAVR